MPRVAHATAIALAAAALAAVPDCRAQVTYNGWNLGPDYGAMINQQLQQQQMMNQQMQQREAMIVQQVMQDPRAQALYQQHRAQGGQLSFPQFAYQYAATGGFTPEGMARFRQSESASQQREQQSWAGLQQAQRDRAEAQQAQRDGYWRNQNEAGLGLQGRGTYYDPGSGGTLVLPNLQPGQVSRDPRTGQAFVMDQRGNYYGQAPNGQWYPLQPAR